MRLGAKLAVAVLALGAAGLGAFWFLTAPDRLDEAQLARLGPGDAGRGERIFWAGGCASCHSAARSEGEAQLQLAGGVELDTPFGTFVAPNLSQHSVDGIGAWSVSDFANAMLKGISPSGEHYYPAFPYTSYARMDPADIADLFAFLQTLPAVEGRAPGHRLGFPYNIRRGLGLWKHLHLSDAPVIALADDASDEVRLGRSLVEGAGHCGECHTPRDVSGGSRKDLWLAGAPAAEGTGVVPNITPGSAVVGGWSQDEIAGYLQTGDYPDFSDSVGGVMAEVVRNLAKLGPEDRSAIAAYLKATPAHAEAAAAAP